MKKTPEAHFIRYTLAILQRIGMMIGTLQSTPSFPVTQQSLFKGEPARMSFCRYLKFPLLLTMLLLLPSVAACSLGDLSTAEPGQNGAVSEPDNQTVMIESEPSAATPTAVAVAAAPTAVPPTAVPPTAVPPTAVPPTAVPPTAVPPTATAVAAVNWATVTNQVDYERHALGNPTAALTIVEFSDFM